MFYVILYNSILESIFFLKISNINNYDTRYKQQFMCTYFSEKKELIKEKKDFPLETFVKIGRKLSQDDIYYTENKEYVILYKKKLN